MIFENPLPEKKVVEWLEGEHMGSILERKFDTIWGLGMFACKGR